jgi:hypothetical protein
MKPVLPLLLFGAACIAQWAVPLASIRMHEEVIERGTQIRVAVTAPDPYDPLRGRYLRLRPVEAEVALDPSLASLKSGHKVWAQLEKGADGLHHPGKITEQKPDHGDYVPLTTRGAPHARIAPGGVVQPAADASKVRVEWPFDRFFVNEKIAPEADVWLRESSRGKKSVVAELRVLNGESVLTNLEVDGSSFREVLKKNAQKSAEKSEK